LSLVAIVAENFLPFPAVQGVGKGRNIGFVAMIADFRLAENSDKSTMIAVAPSDNVPHCTKYKVH
jgi:hypothetical protein